MSKAGMFADMFVHCAKPGSVFELAGRSFCGKVAHAEYHPPLAYMISGKSLLADVLAYRSRILSYSLCNLSLASGMLTP